MPKNNEIQSLALVGEFLRKWSRMEHTLHLAISAATKLDPLMNTILCANLTIREKLNVLKTIVDTSNLTAINKTTFKALLRDIGEYTSVRNMIAHDHFLPVENAAAVGFMQVKAKGKFDTPTNVWTADDFELEYKKIETYEKDVLQLMVSLEHASFDAENLEIPMKIVGSSNRRSAQVKVSDQPRKGD